MKFFLKYLFISAAAVGTISYFQPNNSRNPSLTIVANAQPQPENVLAERDPKTKIVTKEDERGTKGFKCSFTLRQALNAAIAELYAEDFIVTTLNTDYADVPYYPISFCPLQKGTTVYYDYPTYDADKFKKVKDEYDALPDTSESGESKENYKFFDQLEEVLITGVLKVAGATYDDEGTAKPYDFGDIGNYTVDPPTGYFPDYLEAIVEKIATEYDVTISIEYLYVTEPFTYVMDGDAQMTDLYMLQAGTMGTDGAQMTTMVGTCPLAAASNMVLTKTTESVSDMAGLKAKVDAGTADTKTILFNSQMELDLLSLYLPAGAILDVVPPTATETLEEQVEGTILAGVTTWKKTSSSLSEFSMNVDSTFGPFLAKTNYDFCIWAEYSGSPLAATVNALLIAASVLTVSYYMYS